MAVIKNSVNIGDFQVTGDLIANNISIRTGTDKQILLADGTTKDMGTSNTTYLRNDGTWATPDTVGSTIVSQDTLYFVGVKGTSSTRQESFIRSDSYMDTVGRLRSKGLLIATSDNDNHTSISVDTHSQTPVLNITNLYEPYGSSGVRASNISFSGYSLIQTSGTISAVEYSSNQGFFETSDIRKKNILKQISVEKAYELVDKCQTIFYTLKDDEEQKQHIGVIAQEVQEYFPELVLKDADGFLSIDYAKLSVILISVIKDMKQQFNNFEQRLTKLENK